MALVRNRKDGSVGLLTNSHGVLKFETGDHEYPDELVADLNRSRKSTRAYLEGDPPVIEILDGKAKPAAPKEEKPKANAVIAKVKICDDLQWLEDLKHSDDRKTVQNAIQARLEELADSEETETDEE